MLTRSKPTSWTSCTVRWNCSSVSPAHRSLSKLHKQHNHVYSSDSLIECADVRSKPITGGQKCNCLALLKTYQGSRQWHRR